MCQKLSGISVLITASYVASAGTWSARSGRSWDALSARAHATSSSVRGRPVCRRRAGHGVRKSFAIADNREQVTAGAADGGRPTRSLGVTTEPGSRGDGGRATAAASTSILRPPRQLCSLRQASHTTRIGRPPASAAITVCMRPVSQGAAVILDRVAGTIRARVHDRHKLSHKRAVRVIM